MRRLIDKLTERPARVGIAGLVAGIGIGLLLPLIVPYWRVMLCGGIIALYAGMEWRNLQQKRTAGLEASKKRLTPPGGG